MWFRVVLRYSSINIGLRSELEEYSAGTNDKTATIVSDYVVIILT